MISKVRGVNNVLVGMLVEAKSGDLEEDIMQVFIIHVRKYFTGVLVGFICKNISLVMFLYGFDNYLSSNQITAVK